MHHNPRKLKSMVKTALISVSNKEGIVEFAKGLATLKINILSSGGTAKLLRENNIKVQDVSDYTGFPEMMDGRIKTLHPKVHGGILAIRDNKEHTSQAKKHDITLIDMVIVNLYPFKETISVKTVKHEQAIEHIDIGGPTLIRSAAKNYREVIVATDPNEYNSILHHLKNKITFKENYKRKLATRAFKHTARYDALIGDYLSTAEDEQRFPSIINLSFLKAQDLRYGENPHQRAAFYRDEFIKETCIANAIMHGTKELSYNNILDADAALELVKEFKNPACVVMKHANPCGVAERNTLKQAFEDAYNVDPLSAYGCIIAINGKCTLDIAKATKKKFVEVLIATEFDKSALTYLKENKKNLRIIETGKLSKSNLGYNLKKVTGGTLIQTRNWPDVDVIKLETATKRKPTKKELDDLKFAWKVNKHTKSNSVIFCKNKTAFGLGVGQMSRVDSTIIAKRKANKRANDGVLSSDAFFPFRDGVDEAHKAGIRAIIQPGGSIRDQEVIDACNEHDMAMVFTNVRLFKH